jgi:hypothetical protein
MAFLDRATNFILAVAELIWEWMKRNPAPIIGVLSALTVFYSILLVSVLKVRGRAAEYARSSIQGDVKIEDIRVSPGLRIELIGVSAVSKDSSLSIPDIFIKKAELAADIPSLLLGRVLLREISIDSPEITVYRDEKGGYNVGAWLKALEVCDRAAFKSSFPARVSIRDAVIKLEPPPGASWFEPLRLAGMDGVVLKTTDNMLALNMKADVMGSPSALSGVFSPCSSEIGMDISYSSDAFNFSNLRDTLESSLFEGEGAAKLPGGSGKFVVSARGFPTRPQIEGKASLKDFDMSFSYTKGIMRVTELKAGVGVERATASGTIDFNSPDMPFIMSVSIENVRLQRLLRDMSGFMYSPAGLLNGEAMISGGLKKFSLNIESGKAHVTDGTLKLPSPDLFSTDDRRTRPTSIPFKSLTADIAGGRGELRLKNISIEANDFTATGEASIGGFSFDGLFTPGAPWMLNVSAKVPDAEKFAAFFPSFRSRVSGSAELQLSARGSFNRSGDASGSGSLAIRNGSFSNPYAGRRGVPYQTVNFDLFQSSFELSGNILRVKNASLTGNGISVDVSGTIGLDGRLNLAGFARMAPESARDFVGIAPFVFIEDFGSLAMFSSGFTVKGELWKPEHSWQRPTATRWH